MNFAPTSNHYAALRRIGSGEPVAELGACLGDLYLFELVDDDMVNRQPFVTPLGVELLAAHDRLAATVRRERPRLTSRPLPAGWRVEGEAYVHETVTIDADEIDESTDDDLDLAIRAEQAFASLLQWQRHERAVRAQDGAS